MLGFARPSGQQQSESVQRVQAGKNQLFEQPVFLLTHRGSPRVPPLHSRDQTSVREEHYSVISFITANAHILFLKKYDKTDRSEQCSYGTSTMSLRIGLNRASNSCFSPLPTLNSSSAATRFCTSASTSALVSPTPACVSFISRRV